MGNQTSRVIEKTKERRSNKVRRRSTATLGTRSHSSVSISQHSSSHGNYDWIETQTSSGSGAIDTAVAVATVAASSSSSSSSQHHHHHHSHYPNTSNNTSPSNNNTHPNDTLRTEMPRRKSISEVLNKRKGSFSRTTMSQDDFREYDRLQRQVNTFTFKGGDHHHPKPTITSCPFSPLLLLFLPPPPALRIHGVSFLLCSITC